MTPRRPRSSERSPWLLRTSSTPWTLCPAGCVARGKESHVRERKERVHGPYRQAHRWRIVIVGAGGDDQRELHSFETEEEARRALRLAQTKFASRTVSA